MTGSAAAWRRRRRRETAPAAVFPKRRDEQKGIAHFARGAARLSVLFVVDPLVFLGLLAVSYFYSQKTRSLAGGERAPGLAHPAGRISPSRVGMSSETVGWMGTDHSSTS